MKKVLILGYTGKVGSALMNVYKNAIGLNSKDFNALDCSSIDYIIKKIKPDIVINCVAYQGIDMCETNPKKALIINGTFPKHLSTLSKHIKFTLIHFSTECVFPNRNEPFTESDIPNPLNYYGWTKLIGECNIRMSGNYDYYIFRLPLVFGKNPKRSQIVEKMIDSHNKFLSIADDVKTTPTYSKDIAKRVKWILDNRMPNGIYHICNDGKVSLYDLINVICKDKEIKRTTYKNFSYKGEKNYNSGLISNKLPRMRNWKEAVEEYLEEENT